MIMMIMMVMIMMVMIMIIMMMKTMDWTRRQTWRRPRRK